jgi:hypothetical protein
MDPYPFGIITRAACFIPATMSLLWLQLNHRYNL